MSVMDFFQPPCDDGSDETLQPVAGKYIRPYKAMPYKAIRLRSLRPYVRSYRPCKGLIYGPTKPNILRPFRPV